jgi:XTP/dITP diphosphohydrolase
MTALLLATRNAAKTRELAALLGRDFSLRDLTSQLHASEIIESGNTFAENAMIKALTISRLFPDEVIIADDSGLEVDALAGAPGVHSARYAGDHASDRQNIEKLIRELQSLPSCAALRSGLGGASSREGDAHLSLARFRCVIAAAKAGKVLTTVGGDVAGTIAAPARGTNGFGYDPIFVPQGFKQTFGELPAELKNKISHRARAARKLAAFFKAVLR